MNVTITIPGFNFLFCFFETGFCYIALAHLELTIFLFQLSSAGITGVKHHTWLFSEPQYQTRGRL
jgi:hypothetical protein